MCACVEVLRYLLSTSAHQHINTSALQHIEFIQFHIEHLAFQSQKLEGSGALHFCGDCFLVLQCA